MGPTFPMELHKIKAERFGKEKMETHFIYGIAQDNFRGFFVTRTNIVGDFGRFEVFTNRKEVIESAVRDAFVKAKTEGFKLNHPAKSSNISSEAEFRTLLGLKIACEFGRENYQYLFPDADVRYIREPPAKPQWVKDGDRWVANNPLNVMEEVKPTIEDNIRHNPNWGLFG